MHRQVSTAGLVAGLGALLLVLVSAGAASAAAPKVVITAPDNGEVDVDPGVKEIRIEFDQPMGGGRSLVGGGEAFPEIAGEMKWANPKTLVVPVKLKPEHEYWLSVNSDTFKN